LATVTFTVTNTDGTISGPDGNSESEEAPVQLYYKYDPGSGSQESPQVEVDVEQV